MKNHRFIAFCLLFLMFAHFTGIIAPAVGANTESPPFPLNHGLNLSSWLANAPRQPVFARDFAQIKQVGFDHVRLPFNPTYYGYELTPDPQAPARLDFIALDRAIALAEQAHMPVVLDVHPSGSFMEVLENNPWAEDAFVTLWRQIAQHYQNHDATVLAFELLNEPQYYKNETRWNRLSTRLVEAVLAVSPDRTIIIGATHGSSIDGLPFLHPVSDPRLVYAFHFYEPYIITHQGIHQGFETKSIRYFHHLPYPSNLVTQSADFYAPTAPNPDQASKELHDYLSTPWDAAHMTARIHSAKEWADAHNTRVICGEFGVLRNHIDAASRVRWIKDAATAMAQNQIGWEIWDYSDLFGIAPPTNPGAPDPVDGSVRMQDPQKGVRVFEPAALDALGLKPGTAP